MCFCCAVALGYVHGSLENGMRNLKIWMVQTKTVRGRSYLALLSLMLIMMVYYELVIEVVMMTQRHNKTRECEIFLSLFG